MFGVVSEQGGSVGAGANPTNTPGDVKDEELLIDFNDDYVSPTVRSCAVYSSYAITDG
jgi:hypothetical protein